MPKRRYPRSNPRSVSGVTDKLIEIVRDNKWREKAELVVERKTGRVRQAGAAQAEGQFIQLFKQTCEQSLFAFLDGVLNCWFLEAPLHRPVCDWLTAFPPYRKMLLMPRNHGKSTIVPRGIPLHALIQPPERNLYFKKHGAEKGAGTELRLVIAAETEAMAVGHLRALKGALENNLLLRGLWPHVTWPNPRKDAPKWSDDMIIVPRVGNYADPTVRAIGAGGAVTGMHPSMLIKDDLTTQKAANEPPTMQKTIEWHLDSRALFANPDTDLEFITGTYWAVHDLPNFIEKNDPSVQVNTEWRQMVQDGKILFPTKYGYPGAVADLQREHGIKFNLLYMNQVVNTGLTDFLLSDLRDYELSGGAIAFDETIQDTNLAEAVERGDKPAEAETPRGMDLYTALEVGNLEYLRNTRSL
jgi:hypothetical protein